MPTVLIHGFSKSYRFPNNRFSIDLLDLLHDLEQSGATQNCKTLGRRTHLDRQFLVREKDPALTEFMSWSRCQRCIALAQ